MLSARCTSPKAAETRGKAFQRSWKISCISGSEDASGLGWQKEFFDYRDEQAMVLTQETLQYLPVTSADGRVAVALGALALVTVPLL